MGKKASKAAIEQRIELIYRLILDGWETTAIIQNGTVKGWGVKERQIFVYLKRARQRMKKELAQYREVALEEHIAARRKLRREASDGRLALEVLRDEAKLLGLYAPKKLEHTGKDGGPIETKEIGNYTETERNRSISALAEAIRSVCDSGNANTKHNVDPPERPAVAGGADAGG